MPITIAVLILLISAFLSVTTLVTDLSVKYIFAIGAIIVAVALYGYFVYKRHHLRCMGLFNFNLKSMEFLLILLLFQTV